MEHPHLTLICISIIEARCTNGDIGACIAIDVAHCIHRPAVERVLLAAPILPGNRRGYAGGGPKVEEGSPSLCSVLR